MKSIISWKNFLVEKQLDLFQGTINELSEGRESTIEITD